MSETSEKKWKTYEDVARHLIGEMREHFGLEGVEGSQTVAGQSGAEWTIEAKGVRSGDGGFVIIECRRHTTRRLEQESLGGLAFRITDTGATGGIIVSPLGLQDGAQKVAEYSGVQSVLLDENSTTTEYVMRFLKVFVGLSTTLSTSASLTASVVRTRSLTEEHQTSDSLAATVTSGACAAGQHEVCANASCSCSCHTDTQGALRQIGI